MEKSLGSSEMTRHGLEPWTPKALSVLRIMTGLLFLEHGTQKLLGFPPSEYAFPPLFSLVGLQGVLELIGGFLILIGLLTRPIAFILAGDMAVAYFMAHAPKGFFPTLNGGQLAILFSFVFLYLVFAGGGEWSVDAQIARTQLTALRARLGLGGFNSAHCHLINVTPHLFFGAAELAQALLDLLNSQPTLYPSRTTLCFLECVEPVVLFHGNACRRNSLITDYVGGSECELKVISI